MNPRRAKQKTTTPTATKVPATLPGDPQKPDPPEFLELAFAFELELDSDGSWPEGVAYTVVIICVVNTRSSEAPPAAGEAVTVWTE